MPTICLKAKQNKTKHYKTKQKQKQNKIKQRTTNQTYHPKTQTVALCGETYSSDMWYHTEV